MAKARVSKPSESLTTHNKPVTQPAGAVIEMDTAPMYKPVGICSTCRHSPRCLFFKAARQAIHTCEEFDDVDQPGDPKPAKPAHTIAAADGIRFNQGQSVGLCSNCDTRLTCMHRKPGDDVQECEDYN